MNKWKVICFYYNKFTIEWWEIKENAIENNEYEKKNECQEGVKLYFIQTQTI